MTNIPEDYGMPPNYPDSFGRTLPVYEGEAGDPRNPKPKEDD